jgi:hypothetical protein
MHPEAMAPTSSILTFSCLMGGGRFNYTPTERPNAGSGLTLSSKLVYSEIRIAPNAGSGLTLSSKLVYSEIRIAPYLGATITCCCVATGLVNLADLKAGKVSGYEKIGGVTFDGKGNMVLRRFHRFITFCHCPMPFRPAHVHECCTVAFHVRPVIERKLHPCEGTSQRPCCQILVNARPSTQRVRRIPTAALRSEL